MLRDEDGATVAITAQLPPARYLVGVLDDDDLATDTRRVNDDRGVLARARHATSRRSPRSGVELWDLAKKKV